MKVGLVLGAGGPVGGAWLTGGLHALATETGWDPASADHIVGTSAGAMMGALLGAGVPPWFMVAHSAGESFEGLTDGRGDPTDTADRGAGATFRADWRTLQLGPGSWRLIAGAVRAPRGHRAATLAGWLPPGIVSTDPLKDAIRRVAPDGWAPHPGLWIVACDYATGRRVAFGRADAPPCDLADAVAASCAIPGFYRPVEIGRRRYVDGGLWSTSNLDILRAAELDLIICLNPTSSLHPTGETSLAARLSEFARRQSGRRLGSEARTIRAAGTKLVLIQPTDEDHAVMGVNLMNRRNRNPVIQTAMRTIGAQLRDPSVRELLEGLAPGDPHRIRRPEGPPSGWPQDVVPRRRDAA
jgi:NTE family protein